MSLILDCRLEFLVRRKSFIGYKVLKVEMMEMWRAESLAAAEYIAAWFSLGGFSFGFMKYNCYAT